MRGLGAHVINMPANQRSAGEKALPAKVTEEGCQALNEGKERIVTGLTSSKFIGNVVTKLAPDTVKAGLHAAQAAHLPGLTP